MTTAPRRTFLVAGAVAGAAGLLGSAASALAGEDGGKGHAEQDAKAKPGPEAEEISAVEDLMREHGVLRRVLLVYEECARRLRSGVDVPPDPLLRAAALVRKFVENYHEKLEENFLFPEFAKRKQLVSLVKVLREQHAAGRTLTDSISKQAQALGTSRAAVALAKSCRTFCRMYAPHAAREDTVLFPALRKMLSAKELDELGDKFEHEEDRLFGENGFGKSVDEVAAIERKLGIYDLAQFTPKVAK